MYLNLLMFYETKEYTDYKTKIQKLKVFLGEKWENVKDIKFSKNKQSLKKKKSICIPYQ